MSASSMPATKARSSAACAGSTIRASTGGLGAQPEKIVYRAIDCSRIAETDDRNHRGGEQQEKRIE